MPLTYAILVGVLFGVGVYLLLRETIVDHVFGLIVLGHAANLLVFGAGRLTRGAPPVLDGARAVADPLPPALVLTAIVIGLAVVAFSTVLVSRLVRAHRTDDVSTLGAEPPGTPGEEQDET